MDTAFLARYRGTFVVAVGLLAPLGIAAVLAGFRGSFVNTAAALVLVAVIVAVAVLGTRFAGYVASISAALWFDFFLTKPYERFVISHRPDVETTVALFVVGVIVTELAARSRHHALVSSEESEFVAMLGDLTEMASRPVPIVDVVDTTSKALTQLLHLRACRFETVHEGHPLARILADGTVDHVGLDWPVADIGIPGPEAEIPAQWRGLGLGRFILTPTQGRAVSRERRVVAVAMVGVAAATLNDARRVP
jgi:K+-sensing histidine kinase KdpD